MTNKVYMVFHGGWEDWELRFLCSSSEIAQSWADKLNRDEPQGALFPWSVDEMDIINEGPSSE